LFDAQEFVSPEHVHEIAVPVLAHRLMLEPQAKFSGISTRTIVEEIVKRAPVPV
jgi:MoxR-like ATPase